MEITSPINLWKGYDVYALPFNVAELSERKTPTHTVKDFYFDGYTTVDGRTRAYVKIYEPDLAKGVILYMGGDSRAIDDELIHAFSQNGYVVAELDYMGESDIEPRYTLYPKSLTYCNARGKTEFEPPSDSSSSCWFIWTCMARRAIAILKQRYDLPIFAIGKGLGGTTVYKLAAFDDGLSGVCTLLNILPEIKGSSNLLINYRASLDNTAYAPLSKQPIMMVVCSNDEDNSLDTMSALAKETTSLKCLRIIERAFSGGISAAYNQVDVFFTNALKTESNKIQPLITASNSENKLYFNISAPNGSTDCEIELYAAFCVSTPSYRNWSKIHTLSLGDGEYMAHADVLQDDKPVYAFVNATKDEYTASSCLLTVLPKALHIPAAPTVKRRLIYDGSMGKDVWTSPDGGKIEVTHGLFGIDGITSSSHKIATFKPGDQLYRANNDSLLQIMISGTAQSVTLILSDEIGKYSCKIDIPNGDNWHKFTLSHEDFKCDGMQLADWSKIILLEFDAESDFIISSVLWV